MAQEINEAGVIGVVTDKNVVFNKRTLTTITVNDGDVAYVNIRKLSDVGEVSESVAIPWEMFEGIEDTIWSVIDALKTSEV